MSEEEIRRGLLEERRLGAAMDAVYRELVILERSILERRSALAAIEGTLKAPEEDKVSLLPIGGGIFLPAILVAEDRALVNVGADIYISRPRSEAKEFLEKSLGALNEIHQKRSKLFQELRGKHEAVYTRLLEHRIRQEGMTKNVGGT